MQPALAAAMDDQGRLWLAAGYTVDTGRDGSSMGLSVRAPDGPWIRYPALQPEGGTFRPSGDAWLAAAQDGKRAYYVSLLETHEHWAHDDDDVGDGLTLSVIDFSSGSPQVAAPRRIDLGDWPNWDEPTVVATHPPGASADTLVVAGTPIRPHVQDVIAVLVSHDGGASFHEAPLLRAPGYPGHYPPGDTLVRPVLQQDPRPGQECHAYLAFGVYYASALSGTAGIQPPACATQDGCRSIAETQTTDCGETWTAPTFVAVDTGAPQGEDFRGFSYAVAADGTRLVLFGDEDAAEAPILLKRAAAGASFAVVQGGAWDDGPMETVASGPGGSGQKVRRWRPTLAASGTVAAFWVEEDAASQASALWASTSAPAAATWTTAQPVDDAGVACDLGSDDYMAALPEAPFGVAANRFVVAWAPFVPCGSHVPRRVGFATVP